MAEQFDADIIVAGAGPSGLMVSYEARLGGASVLTLEKRNGPTWSRAGTLAPRVMEMFASRGLAEKFLARALELHTDPRASHGIWAGLPTLYYEKLATEYPYVLLFAQLETERLLAQEFQAIGGDLRLQTEVIGHTQHKDGIEVEARLADGSVRKFRARYLVGADGNKSTVRQSAGIAFVGAPASRVAVNVDAYVENPYKAPVTVFNSAAGWAMAYPLRDGVTRLAFIDAATCHEASQRRLEQEEALAMLRRVHGSDFGITRIDAINTFHDALFMAEKMRDRRVFLVGESVRVHYPASGVGMNFCLQDAFNLGWKLAAVATGTAAESLLESYETERRPEVEKLLDDVRRQCAIQFNFDREHIALKQFLEHEMMPIPAVNLRLCENLSGLSVRYATAGDAHPFAGRRLVNLALRTPDGRVAHLFELLRTQQFLLISLAGEEVSPPSHTKKVLGAVAVSPSDHPELAGARALLVRPDGYIAWVGTEPLAQYFPNAEIAQWIKWP
jgi:2-polyprenyl-6-methoxyphenol hydroxylase-like FAD-dependent oxidoreductase